MAALATTAMLFGPASGAASAATTRNASADAVATTASASRTASGTVAAPSVATVAAAAKALRVTPATAERLLRGVEVVQTRGIAPFVQPDVSVRLDWYVHIRLSPQDQRLVIQATSALATLVCVASPGLACQIARQAADFIVLGVATYLNPRCWIDIKLTYFGQLVGIDRHWRC